MKRKHITIFASIVALMVLVVTLPPVFGEPPEGKGKKGDVGKSVEGFLYGDLYVIERDGNGQPVLYEDPSPCYEPSTGVACAQPLMADCSYVPLMCQYDGDWTQDAELIACLIANGVEDPLGEINPENVWEPELCDLHPCFVDTVQEVHFGRMSVARTTPDVVQKAYIEALSTINSAVAVDRDLAGRIVLELPLLDEGGVPYSQYVDNDFDGYCDSDLSGLISVDTYKKTIDSPLENLSLYREMMLNSCLGGVIDTYVGEGGEEFEDWIVLEPQAIELLINDEMLKHLLCDYPIELTLPLPTGDWWLYPTTPGDVVSYQDHDLAATFVAAAADKAGHVNLDMIVNANSYLEINTVYQANQGQAPVVTYHNFIEGDPVAPADWYRYNSTTAHTEQQSAQLLTASSSCAPGCFCVEEQVFPFEIGFELVDFANSVVPVCRGGSLLGGDSPEYCRALTSTMTTLSLGENSTGAGCGGANWFTQAAEDAREIINFVHNWDPPDLGECVVLP